MINSAYCISDLLGGENLLKGETLKQPQKIMISLACFNQYECQLTDLREILRLVGEAFFSV